MNPPLPPFRPDRRRGAALVVALLVITVLTVAVVAFMQSMTIERLTSRSFDNIYRAQLAAASAISAGQVLTASNITRFPDSATVWQRWSLGGTTNAATVLYYRANSTSTNQPLSPAANTNITTLGTPVILALPLVSGATARTTNALVSAIPYSPTGSVNLNATNFGDGKPWIGQLPGSSVPDAAFANWVEILESPNLPRNLNINPATKRPINPPVARYAFWIEDESFKVNLNSAGAAARGATSMGTDPSQANLSATLTGAAAGVTGTNVVANRTLLGGTFPTAATAAFGSGSTANTADTLAYLTTTYSAAADVSRAGFLRFNLNNIFRTNISPGVMRENMDRVIAAITNTNAAPFFGQRFYRTATTLSAAILNPPQVTPKHQELYLQRVAAHLKDYLDDNALPTIVFDTTGYPLYNPTGEPQFGIEPGGGGGVGPPALAGTQPIAAIGLENLPRLQEYAIHGRVVSMTPPGANTNAPNGPPSTFVVTIDHYLEFWNPGTRDVVVGDDGDINTDDIRGAFIKIYDMPTFNLGSGTQALLQNPDRQVRINLPNGTRFPAGGTTVVTTAPAGDRNSLLIRPGANVVTGSVPPAQRSFTGTTTLLTATPTVGYTPNFTRSYYLEMIPRAGVGSSTTDYGSAVVFGGQQGFIDSFYGLPIAISGSGNAFRLHRITNSPNANLLFTRGGSLRGNSTGNKGAQLSTMGDPRTLNEQLTMTTFIQGGSANADQTRFYFSGLSDGSVPGESSLGLPNSNYTRPTFWPDYTSMDSGRDNAPFIMRNYDMETIGDLGHITDPARIQGTAPDVTGARGGGRTLRVGQPERFNSPANLGGLWDGGPMSASRTWTAWRLADIFTANTNTNATALIPGLYNINGIARDGGLAFRSILGGYQFLSLPRGTPSTASQPPLTDANLQQLATAMLNRLQNNTPNDPADDQPFWERGEFSEISLFNLPSGLAGINMQDTFDRGREEIVRRSIQMLTTRGNVFKVYGIGQALQVIGTNVVPVATARMVNTFELTPQFTAVQTNNQFLPNDVAAITNRFSAPTNYTIRTITTWKE